LDDDDADRGLLFAFVGAHLDRQFEFIQREWANDGKFIGAPAEKDPLVSSSDGREFTIPKQPIHRRLKGLPVFVVNRGGEYCFMHGLRHYAGWPISILEPGAGGMHEGTNKSRINNGN
jgi:hypothetical protein